MSEQPPEPRQKLPYVPPRVLQVQRRADGDNLSNPCKSSGGTGSIGQPCELFSCSSTLGS